MDISRQATLIGLAAVAPLGMLRSTAAAAEGNADIVKVSRIILGRDDLDLGIAQRVFEALSDRVDGFEGKLAKLAAALGGATERDAALSQLGDEDLDLALAIAQPWYTGTAGIGSEHSFTDGAVFVTFLGAEALRSVEHVLPMQTYSTGAPGWWAETPDGVTAPAMPDGIRDWAYMPPGANDPTARADPEFLKLVMSAKPTPMK